MKNIILWVVGAAAVAVGGFYAFNAYIYHEEQGDAWTPKDTTYIVEGKSVTLVHGKAESEAAPGSASKIVTTYFGNEAVGDLNGDGTPDTAFILTQSTGGSGTFYYAAVALKTDTVYQGTNAILLGDRIAPQTTEIKDGQLIVNYADRAAGEPLTAAPSVGISKILQVEGEQLVVVQ